MLDLTILLNQIDKVTYKIPNRWTNNIMYFYEPFIRAIWTNPDAYNMIMSKVGGSARSGMLCKFWALNNVMTLEQAKATIPICPVCNNEPCVPASAPPKPSVGRGWVSNCCHKKFCLGKYRNSKITQGMIRIHGVANANDMEGMRELKSKLLKQACAERGDEIIKKREETCLSKLGVTNVSKDEGIKRKKAETTFLHYGVENPDYDPETNIKRSMNVIESISNVTVINGKGFKLLHPSEGEFLKILVNRFGTFPVNSNNHIFNNGYQCHIVDYDIYDKVFLELKSESLFKISMTNEEYIQSRLDIVQPNLRDDQRYGLYMRSAREGYHFMWFSNNEIKFMLTSTSIDDLVKYFGYEYVSKSKRLYAPIPESDMDNKILDTIQALISRT